MLPTVETVGCHLSARGDRVLPGSASNRVPQRGTKELSPALQRRGGCGNEPESRRDDRRMTDDVFCRAYGTLCLSLRFSQPSITPNRPTPVRFGGPDERL